jgi:signal transduction histidine kinase
VHPPDEGFRRRSHPGTLTAERCLRDSPAVHGTPPAAQPFAWLRFLHQPLAAVGLLALDPDAWPLYVTVLAVLTVEWPFHIQLADDLEIYPPAEWTAASAAYVVGLALLPVFWLSAALGFALIVLLDGTGLVRASGIAADSVRWIRGRPHPPGVTVDGHLRGFVNVSTQAVRITVVAALHHLHLDPSLLIVVLVTEGAVAVWLAVLPIPGRMAPRLRWRRLAGTLGWDMLAATAALQVLMIYVLLVSLDSAGTAGWVATSAATLIVFGILKRLNDTRLESERRRRELLDVQEELAQRERLAVIGRTASTVFHQVARQHGAIGMFAHLLARDVEGPDGPDWRRRVREHSGRILASLEEANRVVDELMRFGQDRALNFYEQPVAALVEECVGACRPRATARGVRLEVLAGRDQPVVVDKHKIRQALANLLDNAVDASRAGEPVEVRWAVAGPLLRIVVRDYGAGVPAAMRPRLFAPFCTTKLDGIGLGLALARELVEAHGGQVEARDAMPGSEFVVCLPLDPARNRPAARQAEGLR